MPYQLDPQINFMKLSLFYLYWVTLAEQIKLVHVELYAHEAVSRTSVCSRVLSALRQLHCGSRFRVPLFGFLLHMTVT